jgi:uncharacterized membrane protein YkoI
MKTHKASAHRPRPLSPLARRAAAALLLLLVVSLSLLSLTGRADDSWRDLHRQVQAGELVPLTQLLDWLEDHYEGQVLEVELERDDGQVVYEIEMIGPQGQLVEFEFDARSGELIGMEGVNISAMEKTP